MYYSIYKSPYIYYNVPSELREMGTVSARREFPQLLQHRRHLNEHVFSPAPGTSTCAHAVVGLA
jgi:hypothetical protein